METIIALIVGPVVMVVIGTILYCAFAIAFEIISTPISLIQDARNKRRQQREQRSTNR